MGKQIIGIHNAGGLMSIGDTLYTGSEVRFKQMPSFSPEVFAYISNPNPSKYKNYRKGLSQLLEEGAVSLLRDKDDAGNGIPLLAAVGQLQFEVVMFRLKHEYQVDALLKPLVGYTSARWALGGWTQVNKAYEEGKLFGTHIVKDKWDRPVVLFRNPWKIDHLKLTEAEHRLGLTPCAPTPET
jgi:peptide chain release factor 3